MERELFNFGNLLRIIEALPFRVPDDAPLAEHVPRVWPTVGELRELVASQVKDGDKK